MRESTAKATIFWLVVVFTIWGVWLNVGSLLMTMVAGSILIASLNSFYLPTTYRIDHDGASWKRLSRGRTIEWSRVRLVSDEKEGLFLSPFGGRTMMENFRGLYLPYRANRDEILRVVRQYVPEANGWKDPPNPSIPDELPKLPVRNFFGHQR